MNEQPAYNFDDARYAKNCIAVTIPSNDGWKSPAHVVADGVKARFSHREHAYIMTQSQFRRFKYAFQDVCKHPATRVYSWFAYNCETGKKDILCAGCSDCGKVLAGGAE